MKLLLDTHVWLWWNTEPERLARTAHRQIGDARNEVFLSAASVWEMAIKRRLGKLAIPESVGSYVARRLIADDVKALPVSVDHAAAVETLELLHRDPFDRLLIIPGKARRLAIAHRRRSSARLWKSGRRRTVIGPHDQAHRLRVDLVGRHAQKQG